MIGSSYSGLFHILQWEVLNRAPHGRYRYQLCVVPRFHLEKNGVYLPTSHRHAHSEHDLHDVKNGPTIDFWCLVLLVSVRRLMPFALWRRRRPSLSLLTQHCTLDYPSQLSAYPGALSPYPLMLLIGRRRSYLSLCSPLYPAVPFSLHTAHPGSHLPS